MNRPSIVFADPRPLVTQAVTEALVSDFGLDAVGATEGLDATVCQLQQLQPDVAVLSHRMGRFVAVVCDQLREHAMPTRVLVFDSYADEEALLHAIEGGADGYVVGSRGVEGLADAICAIARGEAVVPGAMLGALLRRLIQRQREAADAAERLVRLTPREREVVALLVDGCDQRDIATALSISQATVRTHVQRLLSKLDVRSRAEAVALVARTGMADRLGNIVDRSA